MKTPGSHAFSSRNFCALGADPQDGREKPALDNYAVGTSVFPLDKSEEKRLY